MRHTCLVKDIMNQAHNCQKRSNRPLREKEGIVVIKGHLRIKHRPVKFHKLSLIFGRNLKKLLRRIPGYLLENRYTHSSHHLKQEKKIRKLLRLRVMGVWISGRKKMLSLIPFMYLKIIRII